MNQDNARSGSVRNKDNWFELGEITEERQSDPFAVLSETLAGIRRKTRANEQVNTEPEQQRNSTAHHRKPSGQLDREISKSTGKCYS